jgi:hypothetical protein
MLDMLHEREATIAPGAGRIGEAAPASAIAAGGSYLARPFDRGDMGHEHADRAAVEHREQVRG